MMDINYSITLYYTILLLDIYIINHYIIYIFNRHNIIIFIFNRTPNDILWFNLKI